VLSRQRILDLFDEVPEDLLGRRGRDRKSQS
jgi:hypothetical protein